MNSIRFFKKARFALNIHHPRNVTFSHTKQNCQIFVYPISARNAKQPLLRVPLKLVKHNSNCNFMTTNDSNSPTDDEKMRKLLDDEEFRNILKDFANDFGVENEDGEILEDIRKNIESKSEEKDVADHHTSSNLSLTAVDLGLNKFKEFSDSDAAVIRDYHEQYNAFTESEVPYHIDQELKTNSSYHDLKRGLTGVFDIDELIKVLHNENLHDVSTISIPKELHYADFLVLATAKSERHSEAFTELLLKLYKQKKNKKDPFVKVEGEKVSNWKAIDMGNIVLHIFLEETRAVYDIESLWLFDSNYDSGGYMQPDPMFSILEEQMAFFTSMQQSQSSEKPKDIS